MARLSFSLPSELARELLLASAWEGRDLSPLLVDLIRRYLGSARSADMVLTDPAGRIVHKRAGEPYPPHPSLPDLDQDG